MLAKPPSAFPSFRFLFALLIFFFLFLALLPAENVNNIHPTSYVTDLAGVLDPAAKLRLENLCTELEQKAGAQMAIVTVHSLEGETVEQYAVDLFKQLGVGAKKDSRGVLLLLSPEEHKYRVEVGYGLEPVINDARAGDAGRAMVPFLLQGDYSNAVLTATWQLANDVAKDRGFTLSGAPPSRARKTRPDDSDSFPLFPVLFLVFIVIRFLAWAIRNTSGRRGGGGGWWIWPIIGGLSGGGFGGSSGGWSDGGSFGGSSGGFGGFGGGSSGGGGASGSW